MSLEELEDAGVLLPEENWGKMKTVSNMNPILVVIIGIMAIGSIFMMLIGDGMLMTFIGIGLFLLDLVLFTAYGIWAINNQNKILDELN